jgi:hypothetical protein
MCRLLEEIYWWEIEKISSKLYLQKRKKNVDATKLVLTVIDHDPKTETRMRRSERQSGGDRGEVETSFGSLFFLHFLRSRGFRDIRSTL